MSRESFLLRVREAAAAGRAFRVQPAGPDQARVGYCGAGDDKIERLAAEVRACGGQAEVVADLPAAAVAVQRLMDEYQPQRALVWQHSVLSSLGLNELLARRRIERIDYDAIAPLEPDEQRRRMLTADVGITSATWAVAETGTLAMCSAPGRERLASLLPPAHIAVVQSQQILPDLFDLFDELHAQPPERLASNVTLITGPSKTGDLELRLTTGVHGPGRWHVIVARA